MAQAKIKKDMTVRVIAGADRGKVGKVLKVDREKGRVAVEGVAIRKKTIRRHDPHLERDERRDVAGQDQGARIAEAARLIARGQRHYDYECT